MQTHLPSGWFAFLSIVSSAAPYTRYHDSLEYKMVCRSVEHHCLSAISVSHSPQSVSNWSMCRPTPDSPSTECLCCLCCSPWFSLSLQRHHRQPKSFRCNRSYRLWSATTWDANHRKCARNPCLGSRLAPSDRAGCLCRLAIVRATRLSVNRAAHLSRVSLDVDAAWHRARSRTPAVAPVAAIALKCNETDRMCCFACGIAGTPATNGIAPEIQLAQRNYCIECDWPMFRRQSLHPVDRSYSETKSINWKAWILSAKIDGCNQIYQLNVICSKFKEISDSSASLGATHCSGENGDADIAHRNSQLESWLL